MQLKKEKGWGEDEMSLSASQNSARFQKKEQLQDQPQDSREDVATVPSGDIRKSIAENGLSSPRNNKNKLTKKSQNKGQKKNLECTCSM